MTDTRTSRVHVGRSWEGHALEDDCPCPKAPCGLVPVDRASPDCGEHGRTAARSMRQAHQADTCPAEQPSKDRE